MSFEQFLQQYSQYISIAIFILIAIVLAIYLIVPLVKRGKKPVREEKQVDQQAFYQALGGVNNVIRTEMKGSRLSVELNEMNAYDKDKLKALGVVRVIVMKTKLILLVGESFKQMGEKK